MFRVGIIFTFNTMAVIQAFGGRFPAILECNRLHQEANDKAIDWLLKSQDLEDETERQIAKLYYQLACRERAALAKRLNELCQNK